MAFHLDRDKVTTFFRIRSEKGRLPAELNGFWTSQDRAEEAIRLYKEKVAANAAKSSSQVRKAKANEVSLEDQLAALKEDPSAAIPSE